MRKKGGLDKEKQHDLLEGETAASSVLVRANEAIAKEERQVAVDELLGRVADWKGHNISHFGELLLYGTHTVLKGEGQKEVEREVRVIFDTLDPFSRFSAQTAAHAPSLMLMPYPGTTRYTVETWSQDQTLGYKYEKVKPVRKPKRKSKPKWSWRSKGKSKLDGFQDPGGNQMPNTSQKLEGNQTSGVTRKPAYRNLSQNLETRRERSVEPQVACANNLLALTTSPTRPPPPPLLSVRPLLLSPTDETCSMLDILAEDPTKYFPLSSWTSNNEEHSASTIVPPKTSLLTKLFSKIKRSPTWTLPGNRRDRFSVSSLTREPNESTIPPKFPLRFPNLISELAPSTGLDSKAAVSSDSSAKLFSRARVRLRNLGYKRRIPIPRNRKVDEKSVDDHKDARSQASMKVLRKAVKLPKYIRARRHRLLDPNEIRFLFFLNRALVNKTKFLYVQYEKEIRPSAKAKKSIENATANQEGQSVHAQLQYKVYLFERILLCCKDINPNKANYRLGNNKSLVDKKGKPRLQLKGRIFMQNVTDVVSFSKHGKQRYDSFNPCLVQAFMAHFILTGGNS